MLALTRFQQRRQQQKQEQQLEVPKDHKRLGLLKAEDRQLARRNSAPFTVEARPSSPSTPKLFKDIRAWSKTRKQQPSNTGPTIPKITLGKQSSVPVVTSDVQLSTPTLKPRNKLTAHLYRATRSSSSADSESILHFAVSHEDVATTQRLLGQGAVDVNNLRPPGVAPLHQACAMGNLEIVQLLLRYNADINLKTWQGLSSLKIAASRGYFDVAEFLVNAGAESSDIKNGMQTDLSYP